MKTLEKYKIARQAKFVKFKVQHFVEIPTILHDKAPPPLLDCLKSPPPLNMSPPWLLKSSSCHPCLADNTKIIPPWSQGGKTLCLSTSDKATLKKMFGGRKPSSKLIPQSWLLWWFLKLWTTEEVCYRYVFWKKSALASSWP